MPCETCMLKGIMVKGEVFPCDILIVGESPGYHEKIQGKVFVGESGKLLNQMIYTYLKRKRGEVAIINACRCEIDKRLKEKKSILKQAIKPCRKFFVEDIKKIKPKLIICLGEIALMQVFNKSMTISRNRGLLLDNKEFNCKVFATYHPSFILRRGGVSDKNPYWVIWQKDWQFLHDYIFKKEEEKISYKEYTGNNSIFKGKFLAIDCEWDEKENLIIFSMSDGKTTQYVFPNRLNSVLKDKLRLLFKNKILVFASRPADERIMKKHGFDLSRNIKIDIFHLANLINDNLHINLENIAEVFTDKRKIKEISKQVKKKVWLLEKDLLVTYNCLDTESTAQAFINLYKEIKKDEKLFNYWKKFTLPVEEMLADTGMKGFKINREKLEENLAFVEKKCLELEMELISEIPAKILEKHRDKGLRLSRPDLVIDYLFASRYGLRLKPTMKTDTGKPSTAEDHLVQFSNKKWVDKYLTWKKIGKLYNTFLKGIQKNMKDDDRIYPHFSITTKTGRTACYNPNIQQVPRSMPYIEKLKELYEAPDGWLIGTRDLSQSEIRIVAWLAGEKNILNALKKKVDIHRLTASLVLDKDINEVTKEERQMAKPVNFGFIYGQSAKGFQQYAYSEYGINFTLEEAEKFRSKFFEAYPALPLYHRRCIAIVRKFKQIRSPLGRVRRLPYIDSDDYALVSRAERQAVNFPVQSFSSDLALIAMYLFWKEVKNKKSVQVLWFIHDSIFFMCREDVFDKYMALLKECMEERAVEYIRKHFKIKVGYPVESDGKFGKNWACLKDYIDPK